MNSDFSPVFFDDYCENCGRHANIDISRRCKHCVDHHKVATGDYGTPERDPFLEDYGLRASQMNVPDDFIG